MHTVALAMSFAVGVLILKRRKNTENVRYVKLNEPDSQHAAMITKPTSSWDYKKLKDDPEDDDNLAIDSNDEDNDNSKKKY